MYRDDGINWIKVLPNRRIYIFGAGFNGNRLLEKLNAIGNCEVAGFIDNDPKKVYNFKADTGKQLKCFLLEDYKKIEDKNDILILSTAIPEIGKQLIENHIYHYVAWNQIDFSTVGEEHYNEDYFSLQIEYARIDSETEKDFFQRYIKEKDCIAEFGCGGGLLLSKLKCQSKVGVEINPAAGGHAEKLGIRTTGSLEDLEDESLDVIISYHALEHCLNPYGIVSEMYKKLKPAGKCVCVVPYEPLSYEYSKNDVSQHLYIWNQRTLGNLFRAAGFYIRETGTREVAWPVRWRHMYDKNTADWFHALSVLESDRTGYFSVYVVAEK
ncbi:MAG: class I SAM-dependent methyltransferase [Lachnospiraceae bacterium]|jgi:SAM-dependent methyltransferase|nr:class I SAM-dependent methyltransferase [Lachnospiraceae bacterium]